MSFVADLENAIAKRVGQQPCQDQGSSFYYEVNSANREGCCTNVDVTLYLRGCLNDIFVRICQLTTGIQWTFTVDTAVNGGISYIASLIITEFNIECCGTDKGAIGIIEECIVTVKDIN